MNTRNLSDILNQTTPDTQKTDNNTLRSYTSFQVGYHVELVHRYPDVTDLSQINVEDIKAIGEFCAVTDSVGFQVWTEMYQPQLRRSNLIARGQARAAG